MEEIGKALKAIFDKLSDFFDIFDLSFIISGIASTVAIILWGVQRDIIQTPEIKTTGEIIFAAIVCYIVGLINFASGRWIRVIFYGIKDKKYPKRNHDKRSDEFLEEIIKAHNLSENIIFKDYLNRNDSRGIWRLYVRLWALIRKDDQFVNSLSLLKRYWVMAATYDGLSTSSLITLLLLIDSTFGIVISKPILISMKLGFITIAITLIIMIVCIREAKRYSDYQKEEIIATIADSIEKLNQSSR